MSGAHGLPDGRYNPASCGAATPAKMIDLEVYSGRRGKHARLGHMACIYVMAPSESGPCKIGYALNLPQRLKDVQTYNWLQMNAYYALWGPRYPNVTGIEGYSHRLLKKAGRHLRGEWFDVPVEWAIRTIMTAQETKYPARLGHKYYTHEQMVAVLDRVYWDEPINARA